jgi:quercetin dioxygenase-like cupin family protein
LTEIRRTLLASAPVPEQPGFESRIYLVEYPSGAVGKLHLHTQQCVGYVLEGSFESSFGDDAPTEVHAGQAFVDLPGKPHHFKNADSARPLRFVVAGTFRTGEALFLPLEP